MASDLFTDKRMSLDNSLKKFASHAVPVFKGMNENNTVLMDFSIDNPLLKMINFDDTVTFNEWVEVILANEGAQFGIGGYNECREIYKRSPLFGEAEESRCIHLGIDIWTKAGTPIHSPFKGKIHSFKNNQNYGDYGPTLIAEYALDDASFYILYGHLDPDVLNRFTKGQAISEGEELGLTGNFPENGNWPPHLHLQIIRDLLGAEGDFPGVCTKGEREFYLSLCPDPAVLFNLSLFVKEE